MTERLLTRGEVPVLIAAHHELDISYASLLIKCAGEREKPVGEIITVGFEDDVAKGIQDTLGVTIDVLGEIDEATQLNTSGLYIVKSPEADHAQRILGGTRSGAGAHSVNGIARVICIDRA